MLLYLLLLEIPFGALPETYQRYEESIDEEKNVFRCFSDKKEISLDKVNNGYPDCSDASDEPGTSTFVNHSFYCKNEGYVPEIISGWLVSDGICDCCDGSDEFFNKHVTCPNTCQSAESDRKMLFRKVTNAIKDGIDLHKERLQKGPAKMILMKQRKAEIEAKIARYEEDIEKIENKTKKSKQIPLPPKTIEPTNAEAENNKKNNEEKYENKENNENSQKGSDFKHFEGSSEQQTTQETITEDAKTKEPMWRAVFRLIWHFTFHVPETGTTISDRLNRKTIDDIKDKISKKKDELKEFDGISDFPKDADLSFVPIYGEDYKKGDYRIDFLKEIKKNYQSIGKYNRTNGNIQYYTGGKHCKDTNEDAQTIVELVCWKRDKLASVTEISECHNHAIFGTPSVCTKESLNGIEKLPIEKLENILSSFGMK